ncbi:MAG: HNH/ENDO VII family nuclease [Holosporales bacterium]|jgi:hypothetical protein|nr:HNH/ENDO VII family nuclease [Holosporales bacterium]
MTKLLLPILLFIFSCFCNISKTNTTIWASNEAMAAVIEHGTESFVEYAASQGKNQAEAVRFAQTAVWAVESVATGAAIVGIAKLVQNKATIADKIKTLKASVSSIATRAFQRTQSSKVRVDTTSLESIAKAVELSTPSRFLDVRQIKLKDLNLTREFTSDTFTRRVKWQCTVGTKQTYEVIQRGDIDWSRIRTNPRGGEKYLGKTNLEAAKVGFAPELSDGSLVQLHHIGQKSTGPIVEVSAASHTSVLHRQFGTNVQHPDLPVDRSSFRLERNQYWIDRAVEMKK